MRRAIPLITACLLSVICAEPLFAQQRLFAIGGRALVEIDTAPGSFGRVLRRLDLSPDTVPGPAVPIAGGSALVWATGGAVALYDTRSGRLQYHYVPGFASKVIGTDPGSYRVLVEVSTASAGVIRPAVVVVDLRASTVRTLDLGHGAAYAPRSNALFVARRQPLQPDMSVDVIDVDDGEVLHGLTGVRSGELNVNELGTRLYVTTESGIAVYDVLSGALLSASDGLAPASATIVDEARGRVLRATGAWKSGDLDAFASETLAPIGSAHLPQRQLPQRQLLGVRATWDVSPLSATIVALETIIRSIDGASHRTTCSQSMLAALDVDTGRVRATVDGTPVTGTTNCFVDLVRLTEPQAPGSFAAAVDGRRVSFTWGAEAATRYEIEAGVVPGATNLTIPVTGTEFAIEGVPPGIYHVRVRAVNVIGKSIASQELRLVVE